MKKRLPASKPLQTRAAHGSRRKFEAALAKVADVPPDAIDELSCGEEKAAEKRRPNSARWSAGVLAGWPGGVSPPNRLTLNFRW